MKTQIFYFSGTGNSLYIARELQRKLPDSTVVPIIDALNTDKIEVTGDVVGFVFPIHAFTLPIPVKKFLERVHLNSASYIFAIATRGGSPCRIFTDIDKILKKKGKSLDSRFFINMPNNYIPVLEAPTQAEIKRLEAEAEKKLEIIQAAIVNRRKEQEKDPNGSFWKENILFPVLTAFFHKTGYLNTERNFYSDSNCSGCGLCAKTCLSNKIEMKDGAPHWRKDTACIFCLACIHYCPSKAIQLRKTKTPSRGRYHHAEVTARNIAAQKQVISTDTLKAQF